MMKNIKSLKSLKTLRLAEGLTGTEIARRVGICKSFYHQIENGQKRLSYEMAIKIANIFKKKPDEIFLDDFN